MLDMQASDPRDIKALSAAELRALFTQMRFHIDEHGRHIGEQSKRIDSQAQAIRWRNAHHTGQQPIGTGTHVHRIDRQPDGVDPDHRSSSRNQTAHSGAAPQANSR